MNCYEFRDNISSYIEKALGLSKVKLFDRHRESCRACNDAYEGVFSVVRHLRESERFTVSRSFTERLRSRLERTVTKPTRDVTRYTEEGRVFGFEPKYAVASVAALALIIVLSIGLLSEKNPLPSGNPIPLSTRGDVSAPSGLPEMEPSSASSTAQLADDSNGDSTDVPRDVPSSTRSFDRKMKLVKDRQ